MNYDIFDIILNPYFFEAYLPNEDWKLLTGSPQHLHNKRFGRGVWSNLDLSGMYFDYCRFSATQLVSCNFYNARIKGEFNECKCEDTNFSLAQFFQRETSKTTVFLRCSFVGSIWEKGYSFRDCLFYNCDLTDVVVDNDTNFSGTIFKKCVMSDLLAERLKTLKAVVVDLELSSISRDLFS